MRLFYSRALLSALILCVCLPRGLSAVGEPAPEESRFKILEVKKAYFRLEEEKARYERARVMLEKDLISREEFNDIEAAYKTADVNYSSALLEFLYDQPHVMVEEAVKYQGPEGQRRVRLKIRNTSGEAFQLEQLPIPPEDDFFRDLQWRNLTNVFVSLKLGETIISQPYEAMIPVLEYDRSETIDFGLLRDVDEVVVSVAFADKSVEKKVFLQKDASANIVSVVSSKFSQEADLGKSATYDLRLERFTADDNVFRLRVANLPAAIQYEFVDPNTRAKLTQIKFTDGVTTQNLLLRLYLPERSDEVVRIDRPLTFHVLVGDGEADAFPGGGDDGGLRIDPVEIEAMRLGWVELELIPRGIGEIEVRAQNLYHEIDPGATVSMEIVVRNAGTRRLDNIILETDLPYDWRSSVSPDRIDVLLPDKEAVVRVVFYPPENPGIGDYEAKIKTNAMASGRPVETEDKRVRIHVRPSSGLAGNLLLGLSIVGILITMVIFGVRLSRR